VSLLLPAGAPAGAAISLLTYLWHYTLARLLYDDLVRPIGPVAFALPVVVWVVLVARGRRRR
jgi:hypothetical protein